MKTGDLIKIGGFGVGEAIFTEILYRQGTDLLEVANNNNEIGVVFNYIVGDVVNQYKVKTLDDLVSDVVAIDAVANSTVAMDVVINSTVAMDVVINSTVAMNAVANSTVAMDVVINSTVAMDAVANSTVAMDAVANSTVAMNAIFSSTQSKSIIFGKDAVTKAIANNKNAIEWLVENKSVEANTREQTKTLYEGKVLLLTHNCNVNVSDGYYRFGEKVGTIGNDKDIIMRTTEQNNVMMCYPLRFYKSTSSYTGYVKYVPMDK